MIGCDSRGFTLENKQYTQHPANALATAKPQRTAAAIVVSNLADVADSAKAYAAKDRASRTTHEYGKLWRGFTDWCAAHALCPLPAAAPTLTMYITARADAGIKPSSLQVAISAIARHHKLAGVPSPHDHPVFESVWEGIRRTRGTAPRQVAPVVVDELRAMVATLPDTTAGRRNRAILVVGFAGAFRRSELAELELRDITFQPRGAGLHVLVRHSKTDQTNIGVTVGIPRGKTAETCPVRTLRRWLETMRSDAGPLFRSVDRYGHVRSRALYGHNVASIVKRAAEAAGLDPQQYSGHSLRSGLATVAARSGKDDRRIMAQGRWSSRMMLDRYVRGATLLSDDNAAANIGL